MRVKRNGNRKRKEKKQRAKERAMALEREKILNDIAGGSCNLCVMLYVSFLDLKNTAEHLAPSGREKFSTFTR